MQGSMLGEVLTFLLKHLDIIELLREALDGGVEREALKAAIQKEMVQAADEEMQKSLA